MSIALHLVKPANRKQMKYLNRWLEWLEFADITEIPKILTKYSK